MDSNRARGVLMVLAAALLWGTTGTAQSFATPELSSTWIGALRLVASAMFFAAWLAIATHAVSGARAPASSGTFAALPWPGVLAAALCMTVYNLAFFAGVRAIGVAVGTAIALGSGPIWAGMLQALATGRPPSGAWWAGTLLAVAGGALMIAGPGMAGPGDAATATATATATTAGASGLGPVGIALCLAAGLSYAIYALVNQRLVARAPAGPVTGAIFVLAALIALPIAAATAGLPTLRAADLAVVAWLGVMSTGVAYLLLSHALKHVSGATGVALALFEPVTAFGLAIAVVGERPGAGAFAGLAAVLAGLAIVIRAELRPPAAPASGGLVENGAGRTS